jgi:hypothetical protein
MDLTRYNHYNYVITKKVFNYKILNCLPYLSHFKLYIWEKCLVWLLFILWNILILLLKWKLAYKSNIERKKTLGFSIWSSVECRDRLGEPNPPLSRCPWNDSWKTNDLNQSFHFTQGYWKVNWLYQSCRGSKKTE